MHAQDRFWEMDARRHLAPMMPSIWCQAGLNCKARTTDCNYDVVFTTRDETLELESQTLDTSGIGSRRRQPTRSYSDPANERQGALVKC